MCILENWQNRWSVALLIVNGDFGWIFAVILLNIYEVRHPNAFIYIYLYKVERFDDTYNNHKLMASISFHIDIA